MGCMMSKCTRCNITILDSKALCPVCRGALTREDETFTAISGYPDMGLLAYRKKQAMKIIFFVAVLASIILFVINRFAGQNTRWSWVCAGAIAYAFFTYAFTFQPRVYHQTKIFIQGLLTMVLLWWFDYSLGYTGWSLDYGVPVVLLAMNGLVIVLMMARHRDWQSYALTQLRLFIVGIVVLVLLFLDVLKMEELAAISVAVTDVILFGMLVIGSRKMTMELRRLFRT